MRDYPNPFFDGVDEVPSEKFLGRNKLRSKIASYTWYRDSSKRTDIVLAIEGHPSYGKSSFARWCEETSEAQCPEGEVLVCSINLCDLFDPLSTENAMSRSQFLGHLYIKTINKFNDRVKKKNYSTVKNIKNRALELYKFVETGEYFGIKLPSAKEFMLEYPEKYFDTLITLTQLADVKMKAFIIIIDNVSLHEQGPLVCADLSNAIKRHSRHFPSDFPNILLIVLPFPGWSDSFSDKGYTRRYETHILNSFELTEIEEYLYENYNDFYNFDADYAAMLHFMSGGIPYLFQQIGIASTKMCVNDGEKKRLTANHIINAVMHDSDVERCIKDMVENNLQFKINSNITNDYESKILPLFYRASPIESVDQISEFGEGFPQETWRYRILAHTENNPDYNMAFEKLWNIFIRRGILIQNNTRAGHFMFCAEAVRKYFDKYNF